MTDIGRVRRFLMMQHYQRPWRYWLRLALNPSVQRFRWRLSGIGGRSLGWFPPPASHIGGDNGVLPVSRNGQGDPVTIPSCESPVSHNQWSSGERECGCSVSEVRAAVKP